MIIPEPKSFRHGDENMLPMINIVFLLLIFFMISGVITATDGIALTPMESKAGEASQIDDKPLLIGATGELALGTEPLNRSELVQRLAERGENAPILQLKTDAQTPSAELFSVMRLLSEAGIEHVRLLATAAR